ncbi:MAG: hypothetical protein WD768_00300 [Phycisphaeraceae bacterium]
MKAVTDFIKSNPIVVISAAVVVASLAFLFLFVHSGGKELVKRVESRKNDMSKIDGLTKTNVPIPGEKPDDQARNITVVVNEATIEKLSEVYAEMGKQYDKVTQRAIKHNEKGHAVMMEGLFPKPTNSSAPFTAKDDYRRALQAMLGPAPINDDDAVGLRAGPPPTDEAVQAEIKKVEERFLGNLFKKSVLELTPEDQKRLRAQQMDKAVEMVTEAARRIYIYADIDPTSVNYPFDVGAWSADGPEPTMTEIWEGQMNLWIQRDIVRAIQLANSPLDERGNPIRDFGVIRAPVKHLNSIRVRQGYIGINTSGGINSFATNVQLTGEEPGRGEGRLIAARRPQGEDMLAKGEVAQVFREEIATHDPNKKLPEMFQIVPSGRVSNSIYDVRHVTIDIVVDYQQLPKLFDALGKVNFMTVLNVSVSEVDEYEALQYRYAYGDSDCVRIQMLIETIWLRDWTKKYMPDAVKTSLGISTEVKAPATAPVVP